DKNSKAFGRAERVDCWFPAAAAERVLALAKGQQVKIRGKFGDAIGLGLSECELVEARPLEPVAPPVDQDKLIAELEKLGLLVRFGDLQLTPDTLTPEGDFKPGIAAKLAQLTAVSGVSAIDLPAFGAGAGQAVAGIRGLTRITLWRSKATDAAI